MHKRNVFVIGVDEFNMRLLKAAPLAAQCRFHTALDVREFRGVGEFDADALLERAAERMAAFHGDIHGVLTFWDFPATTILPILRQRFDLPGPSIQAVLACEHKYWSRLEQQRVIGEHIPQFQAFDPFDDEAYEKIDLIPPFWVKPVKSFRSFLSYRINDPRHFREVMAVVREHVETLIGPFRTLMSRHSRRPEFAHMKQSCIAESPLTGAMATLEGYAHDGQVAGYGLVDSVREADRSSFVRYEYPSTLPLEIQMRMIDVARRAVLEIGLDNCPFNAEFFYDSTADHVYLLEVNPRLSQSHADLFQKVHGTSHFQVMLALALGQRPRPLEKGGAYNVAANFMMRAYSDGVVRRAPGEADLARLASEQPDTKVKLLASQGQRLSNLHAQDSYSFELANVFVGGRDRLDLLERYERCCELLPFEIEGGEPPEVR